MKQFFRSVRTGIYLGIRQLRGASKWTAILITSVMLLTFLNLVFVSGILVGLIQGSVNGTKSQYSGDILITRLPEKNYILKSQELIQNIKGLKEVKALTGRYITNAILEANYRTKIRPSDRNDEVAVKLIGINPLAENEVTKIKKLVRKGEFLEEGDEGSIILGKNLLSKYSDYKNFGLDTLDKVDVGAKIRVRIGNLTKELVVKGVLESKVDIVSRRAFIVDSLIRKIGGRSDFNVGEIAIKIDSSKTPEAVKSEIEKLGANKVAIVKTANQALGSYIKQIIDTFGLLGSMFGGIGLVVSSITVFIVVFINAITRRKFIGIMKGIGISTLAIEVSYVLQAVVYAIIGSLIGLVVVYKFAMPYFQMHPINFPFSDGILVAPIGLTLFRVGLLIFATIIAGYLPAKIVSRQNTLDSILGR